MSSREEDLFGQGFKFPFEADSAGRLVMSSGEDRLWESIESILDSLRGTAALDPDYGRDDLEYESFADVHQVAWVIVNAIERSEPRVQEIQADIIAASEDSIDLRLHITPIGSQVSTNRIFTVFALTEGS